MMRKHICYSSLLPYVLYIHYTLIHVTTEIEWISIVLHQIYIGKYTLDKLVTVYLPGKATNKTQSIHTFSLLFSNYSTSRV